MLTTTAVVTGSFVGILQLTSGSVFGADTANSQAVAPVPTADGAGGADALGERADGGTGSGLGTGSGSGAGNPSGPGAEGRSGKAGKQATSAAPAARTAVAPVRTPDVAVAQIVAHPDDDLYFMNPDVVQSIRSGKSLTTVYLTAGEADGVNGRGTTTPPTPDKAGFAAARQNGIRAAYAEMATGSRTSPWDRVSIPTVGGGAAELDVLRAAPHVSLVWMQIREAGAINADRPNSLNGLWNGRVQVLASQRATGTPVTTDFTYSKDQVIDALTGILERIRPTFVRMQDPTPGRNLKTGALTDHQDHLYGARFAQAALERYATRATDSGRPHFGVQNYLGYPTSTLPYTLDPESAGIKLSTLKTYAWTDGINDCGDPVGCGDLKVAQRPAGSGWTKTVRYARGSSTSWVQRGPNGGLYAFSVLDGRLAVWTKSSGTAAEWQGPVLLAGAGLDSGVTSVRLPDGRISVFGTRTTIGATAGTYRREVVSTEQSAPGGAFGAWRSLGTPEQNDALGMSDISGPAAAVDGTGRITVVVRDSAHRLQTREQQPNGSWGAWRSLAASTPTAAGKTPPPAKTTTGRTTSPVKAAAGAAATPGQAAAGAAATPGRAAADRTAAPAKGAAGASSTPAKGAAGAANAAAAKNTLTYGGAASGSAASGGGTLNGTGVSSPVYSDPVATTDAAGRIHVFAGTAKTVLTWSQPRPGAPLSGPRTTGLPATTLALNASPSPTGDGVRLWFRKPASGDVRTADFPGTGGRFVGPAVELAGGVLGPGPIGGGTGMLAVRSRTGFLATAPGASGNGGTGAQPLWTLQNFLFSGAPGGVVDGVAAMGLDGKLHWTPAVR
ncbi:PIG-L family deacetylase [Streptomyces sp. NPDC058579]|uniref:PIG-L family deacetylase n=1 Tax=Streptomyces sp. NPDC058579 TaxID=3346548 RepID=UPI003651F12E